ncbi:D-arabinono-1,4-lactone oxidase [Nocardioides sp. WS12]|uniref:D-arabinono-1,4-lactone oxidase n=1 Tax=Nocardioides sp. WS12 TaxID=2486272 RepID=UPI0015FC6D26|nr:D-arabinono-1,4-lactone oxidase [Nocardioides sp. WS12]
MDTWTNWAGDEHCTPAVLEQPATVDEVVGAVRRAGEDGRTIRVVGAGHSFGDIVCTDGSLMTLDGLTGLLHVDADAGLVRVAAGTRLHELNRLLDLEGLALANLGDIDSQSVAGAISTGTHGTGRLLGNLATFVESLQLVTADGTVLEVSAAESELLAAARLSLGSLGVITAYTLRVVPAFNLQSEDRPLALTEVLTDLDDLVDSNDHFEFFWFPFTDTALTRANNRTDEPEKPENRFASYVKGTLVENNVLDLVCRLGRRQPQRIPQLNRAITKLLPSSTRVDRSHRVFANTRSIRFNETEWAVPREACRSMVEDIRALVERQDLAVNFPIEVRFVAGDEASYLSPAYGRETAYIALHMYQGMAWRGFFAEAERIAAAYDGRPHWGKRHGLDATTLSRLYPEWERFQNLRGKLDPDGRFANDHVRRVFEAR